MLLLPLKVYTNLTPSSTNTGYLFSAADTASVSRHLMTIWDGRLTKNGIPVLEKH